MSENYGVNAKGEFVRLNRKSADITGAKSIRELSSLDKDGKLVIDITKENHLKFRNAVKATMSNIIGSMSSEEVSMSDLNIVMAIFMQFKTWMPEVVRERFGKLRYDERIQAVRQGRFGAYFSGYKPTSEELINGFHLGYYMRAIVVPQIFKTAVDLATFGLASGVSKINEVRARSHYEAWKSKMEKHNPTLANEISFEEYVEAKQHQIKAFISELRIIMIAFGVFSMLGADDDHGDPRYMSMYLTRTMYKMFRKANSELTFMWNPSEFARLIKNPIPMSKLLIDLGKTITNTMDESRDFIFGENSNQDKANWMYYTFQWGYGGSQIARLIELFPSYKNSPY